MGTTQVYSDRQLQTLRVEGLRRLSVVAAGLTGLKLLVDVTLFRGHEWSSLVGQVAEGLIVVGAAISYGVCVRWKTDVSRPVTIATALTLTATLAGALGALDADALFEHYPFGLLPLLFAWPLTMPGGIRASAVAVIGGVAFHGGVLLAATAVEPARLAVGSAILLAVVLTYAHLLERLRARVATSSRVDWLTGSMSWTATIEEFEKLCARRTRHWQPLTLVMFDVDRFERINDKYGSGFGDDVLELIDSAVRKDTRRIDLFGRHGNDEFLLVLDECASNDALEVVGRVRKRLASTPLQAGEEQVRITLSAGIISAQEGAPLNADALVKAVIKALQGSKEAQLNQTNLGSTQAQAPADTAPVEAKPLAAAMAAMKAEQPAPPSKPEETTHVDLVPAVIVADEKPPPTPAWNFPPAPPRNADVPPPPPSDDDVDEVDDSEIEEPSV